MKHLNKLGVTLLAMVPILFVGCQKIQNASARQSALNEEPSAVVEKVEDVAEKPVKKAAEERNEFGFTSNAPSPPKPLRRNTPTIKKPVTEVKKKIADTGSALNTGIQSPNIPAPPIPPAPNIDTPAPKPQVNTSPIVRLGAANLVPGDRLHVTLPGEFASLGPISIERLDSSGNTLGSPWASGTQMQIPNPNLSGGKIYFKVP